MNDTHTTHWSVQCSVYMCTSYMCIKVVLEYNVKDLQIANLKVDNCYFSYLAAYPGLFILPINLSY